MNTRAIAKTVKLPAVTEHIDMPTFTREFDSILTAEAETASDALAFVSIARHMLTETIQATPKGSNASIFALFAWAHLSRAVEALERTTGEKAMTPTNTGQAH